MELTQELGGLLVSLGIGLLMGVERERRKGTGADRRFAGIRTFALTCLAGGLAQASGIDGVVLLGAVLVAGLTLLAYARTRPGDPGATTEVALFVAYLLGATAIASPALAAAVGAMVTLLLAAREHLHRFSTDWLTQGELRDALILTGIALAVLPLLPNRPMVGEFLNPHLLARLVVVLLVLQAMGHVAKRLLGERHGLVLAGFFSGFVSSTATIATMAARARRHPAERAGCMRAAIASNVATMVLLLMVAGTVRPDWVAALWLPALCGALVAAACALPGARAAGHAAKPDPQRSAISLREALAIAMVLTLVQFAAQWLKLRFGTGGLAVAAGFAGLADLHAAVAALLVQAPEVPSGAAVRVLALPVGIAVVANGLSKVVAAYTAGDAGFALRLAPVLCGVSGAFLGVLWFAPLPAA